jgi:multidrug resistance efflux pump
VSSFDLMGVKVKRERPDQRRHHRVTAPIFVTFDGYRLRAADWSLGGLRVIDFPGPLPQPGDQAKIHVGLPFQGFEVSFDSAVEIVRCDAATGMFACQFIGLGERERDLMQHFIEELVRGAMTDVQDTIQRIDVPVTPASLEPDKPRSSQVPLRRWPVKALVMTALYGAIGIGIFGYTALLGYSNFYRLEVQTAVITAPIETVSSQADGQVQWASVKPGDTVSPGALVIAVLDNQLEREIEIADIAIKERRTQLAFLKTRYADEQARMRSFSTVLTKNAEQAKIEVESVGAQVQAAEQQYGRLAHLHMKGFTTDAKLEDAEKLLATLRKTLESKTVELNSQTKLAGQNQGRWHYTGQNMVGETAQLEAEIQKAEAEVATTQQRLEALKHHKERLAVRAPFEGTVLELPHVDRGAVRRGDVIAIIEQRKLRQVTAFLNQDEVLKIGQGDEVLLYVPALGETLKGRVHQIDRTTGFVKEQNSAQNPGYRWRGSVDRSAKVIITFNDPAKVADVERYRSGLPVVAVFPQRSTSALTGSLRQKLSTAL